MASSRVGKILMEMGLRRDGLDHILDGVNDQRRAAQAGIWPR
jgi:hypothetical protein